MPWVKQSFFRDLEIQDWGVLGYDEAYHRQLSFVAERINGSAPDRLVLVEHPPVITLGRSGSQKDLYISKAELSQRGVELHEIERGGQATFHGPGQLVAYPIIGLTQKDLHRYLNSLLDVVCAVLRYHGLKPQLKQGRPGVWIDSRKIASVGIAVKKWVTFHGVALNVNIGIESFDMIVPCGNPGERITSLQEQLGKSIDLACVKKIFIKEFRKAFGYNEERRKTHAIGERPDWLTCKAQNPAGVHKMEELLGELKLPTVCQSAHCPNLGECFNRGTATFLILGTNCTRRCRFCAIEKGNPHEVDPGEPERIARAAETLNLNYIVITSVTRDDLPYGGASQFSRTIEHVRRRCEQAKIEVLIPDFRGSLSALKKVCNSHPDILNHNLETVARLYPGVRPGANYRRSLKILEYASRQHAHVKSGLMLGLGETEEEIEETLFDLKRSGCRYLSLGQYLAPSQNHIPVTRFLRPEEFRQWASFALKIGFEKVAAGPLVRSSYRADE